MTSVHSQPAGAEKFVSYTPQLRKLPKVSEQANQLWGAAVNLWYT